MNKYEVNIYEQIARNIKKYRKAAGITQAVLAENVGGLRSANEGKALVKILEELKNAGYTITPH